MKIYLQHMISMLKFYNFKVGGLSVLTLHVLFILNLQISTRFPYACMHSRFSLADISLCRQLQHNKLPYSESAHVIIASLHSLLHCGCTPLALSQLRTLAQTEWNLFLITLQLSISLHILLVTLQDGFCWCPKSRHRHDNTI